MEDNEIEVEVVSTCMVVPEAGPASESCGQIGERHLFLPGSDSYWRWVPYNGRLLFYDSKKKIVEEEGMKDGKVDDGGDEDGERSYGEAVTAVKKGLARALCDYYPFAGRLSSSGSTQASDERARIEIVCDGQGVPFTEGRTRARFQTLAQDNFQITGFFHALAPAPPPPPPHDDLQAALDTPLLAVQVTRFLEGEMVVGCIHSHVLGDGTSFWNFMVAWAGYANGRGALQLVVPVHDRRLLDFRGLVPGQRNDVDESQRALDICWSHMTSKHLQDASKEPLLTRVFHITHDKLLTIKAEANSSSMQQDDLMQSKCRNKGYTRYEALCAHVWRCVVEARCLGDDATVGLVILADVRRRVEPNIPEGYVGNAVIARTAIATKVELLGEPITDTCARIRKTISKITDSSIKMEMACLEGITRAQLGMWGRGFVCLNVVSSPKFPIFQVDFGWGPPCCARPVSVGMFGHSHVMFAHNRGAMVLFPAKDGGIDLCITLQHLPMQKLVENTYFCSTLVKG